MKSLLKIGLLTFVMALPLLINVEVTAAFDPFLETCDGSGSDSSVCEDKNDQISSGENPIAVTLGNIARLVALFVGIASVFMIIYAGFTYVTSGGDSNRVSKAKNIIIWSVVGLVVAVLAFPITTFIVNQFVAGVFLWQ